MPPHPCDPDSLCDLPSIPITALRLQNRTPFQNTLPAAIFRRFPQQFPEGDTRGVNVGPPVCLRKAVLLRRRTAPCPDQLRIALGLRLFLSGDVKINEPDMSVRPNQQVGGPDVPVGDLVFMKVL